MVSLIKNDKSRHGKLLALWFDRWKNHFDFEKSVMHDPLAIATLISDVCKFEKKDIRVDLSEKRGAIIMDETNGSSVYVATKVNPDLFYKLFIETIYGLQNTARY